LRSLERKYERFKRQMAWLTKKTRSVEISTEVHAQSANQQLFFASPSRMMKGSVRVFCLTGAAIVLRPEASTSFHGFLSEQNIDHCTRHEIMKPPWDSMSTWKSTDISTRFWWGCTENFFVVVPQKASFQEEWFTAKMMIESHYPKANQANSPATTEFFCHNRPPNWTYHLSRQLPAPKLVMRLERRALSTFGRSNSRISCFSKPKRCPGSKHFRSIKSLIVETKNILPGATARPSTTVSIMAPPFGCLVRKVKHYLYA